MKRRHAAFTSECIMVSTIWNAVEGKTMGLSWARSTAAPLIRNDTCWETKGHSGLPILNDFKRVDSPLYCNSKRYPFLYVGSLCATAPLSVHEAPNLELERSYTCKHCSQWLRITMRPRCLFDNVLHSLSAPDFVSVKNRWTSSPAKKTFLKGYFHALLLTDFKE